MTMPASNRSAGRGLNAIGDHLPTTGPLATRSGSVTPRSPTSSTAFEITGSPSPARTGASSIGLRPSETGSGRPTTLVEAQAVLAAATPAVSEEVLRAWLPPSIVSAIKTVWRTRPGSAPEVWDDPYIGDYQLKGELDVEAAREALALLDLLDQRAERREYGKALGRLKSVTVSRSATAEDLALQLDTMAYEMTEFPLDAALEACRRSARVNRFFPSWAELRELCEEAVLFRRALARELRCYLDGLDQEPKTGPCQSGLEGWAIWIARAHDLTVTCARLWISDQIDRIAAGRGIDKTEAGAILDREFKRRRKAASQDRPEAFPEVGPAR